MKKEQLQLAGIDYDTGMKRFMNNKELYENLLTRFLEDRNFVELKAALDSKNIQEAYEKAHTLKGVSGNLSLVSLYHSMEQIVYYLRMEDLEQARSLFKTASIQYDTVSSVIKQG